MKTLLCVAGVASLVLCSSAMAQKSARLHRTHRLKHHRLNRVKPRRLDGIDPAAIAIKFKIVKRTSQFRGRVRISGVVKNVGTEQYIDPRGRSGVIQLFRAKRFTTDNLVASAPLRNLKPGKTQTVSFVRNWNSSSPNEGEFPPTYYLNIGYDPDILQDSCPTNDDKRLGNNRRERSGKGINDMFANTKYYKPMLLHKKYLKIGK